MTEEPIPHASIDWATISLPSDRLTLGQLRLRAESDPDALEVLVYNLVSYELEIAGEMLIEYPPGSELAKLHLSITEEKSKELAALYVDAGVAAGPREAKLLVDELLAAAAAHVRSRQTPRRG